MFYVLGDGGAKFGPADVATLKQWVTEGRLTAATMLEDAVTGQVMAASSVPDLFGSPVMPPPATPSYSVPGPPSHTTEGPVSSPYGAPHTPGPSQGYSAPPNQGNPYPRNDMSASPEADKYATWTWILGGVGLLCCPCCFGAGAIFTAVKAKQLGHPKGDILLAYAIGTTVAGFIIGAIVNAASGTFSNMMNR